jgi:hypothetical protein
MGTPLNVLPGCCWGLIEDALCELPPPLPLSGEGTRIWVTYDRGNVFRRSRVLWQVPP